MSSITETSLEEYFNEFTDNMKRNGITLKKINEKDTNVDMMLKSFLILRNIADSYNFIKAELIKYINSQNKYICSICNASYDNPYSYGGHMSKHSKYKDNNVIVCNTKQTPIENREYYLRSAKDCIVIM